MAPLLARRPPADRAFERMYNRHVGDVYRYVHAVLRNADDAEDVTQTTFMNAYRAFQRGERPEQPKNWLITIAHNVCRQRFRQLQRRPSELPLFEDSAELAVEEPEESYSADDIQRALGQLAFNQRAALVMRELEGRSYAEIAEIMGLTVGAVETLIFRGRRALREQLEGQLTCAQAELALSKQTDGVLPRAERGQLRAHLRECKECESLARRQRATRGALKALGAIPLPTSLASFFGGGGSAVTAAVAAKAAAVVFAGTVVGTAGYEGAKHANVVHPKPVAATPRPAPPTHARIVTHAAAPPHVVAPSSATATARVEHKAPRLEHVKRAKRAEHPVVVVKPSPPKPAKHEAENPVRAQKHERENPVLHGRQQPKHAQPQHVAKPKVTGKSDGPKLQHEQPAKTIPHKPLPPVVTTAPKPKPEQASGRAKKTATTTTAETTTTTVETTVEQPGQGNGRGKK